MTWICSYCARAMDCPTEVGYEGPADADNNPDPENTDCNPYMAWLVLCTGCAREVGCADDRDAGPARAADPTPGTN